MSQRLRRCTAGDAIRCLALTVPAAMLALLPPRAAAQVKKVNTASATVMGLAAISNISSLTITSQSGNRLYLTGTVTTVNMNGPYSVQSQLASALSDTVYGKTPSGTYVQLTTTTWVTVAQGTGAASRGNAVNYIRAWSSQNSQGQNGGGQTDYTKKANIPLNYRVTMP